MSGIPAQITQVQEEIENALQRCGRKREDVKLVAISKTHPPEAIREAFQSGIRCFGENRVQEAEEKMEALSGYDIEWHLVGPLQTNKVRKAISRFHLIHSVDREKLVLALNQEAEKQQKIVSVLLQINIGEEETKSGVHVAELEDLIAAAKKASWLKVKGLMTIPPYLGDPEEVRPFFRRIRELGDKYQEDLVGKGNRVELSMGMTHDFPIAIEEGATLIRVGTAIFGVRPGF